MQLKPEQLQPALEKALKPVYLISGDEPLQHMESCDAIRTAARNQGYSERQVFEVDKGFDWNQLAQAGASLSLFAERRLLELRLRGGPGTDGGAALAEYCARPPDDTLLLISTGKLDGRSRQSKWYKAIDRDGATLAVWPIEPSRMADWVIGRCRQRQLDIDRDAAEWIAQRVEGNLLAAAQEVEKLCLLAAGQDRIDLKLAASAVADSARYDVFAMVQSAYSGDLPRTLRMLQGLRDEGVEAIAIHGALMWQLRRACHVARAISGGANVSSALQQFKIFDNQRNAYQRLLKRHSADVLLSFLRRGGSIDGMLKGYRPGDAWQALAWLLARLAGYDLPAAARI